VNQWRDDMKFIKKIIIIGNLLVAHNTYAEKTYVFCSTSEGIWRWLLDNNGHYVTAVGEWKTINEQGYVYTYFKIADKYKVKEFQQKCFDLFGKYFIYAQPANYAQNIWYVFGNDKKILNSGLLSIYVPGKRFPIIKHQKESN